MNRLTNEQLAEKIQELITCHAFELHKFKNADGTRNIYIPYMMNDALECYILLENARITGKYLSNYTGETTVKTANDDTLNVLVFHQGKENVFTLWFEQSYQVLNLYRYDQIGHFWVKGEEHWRRLVYIIGTIYDKYEYMGASVCNKDELELLPLMEFAPFRHYSPISDSLDEHYLNSQKGLETMMRFAEEAKDTKYLRLLKWYQRFQLPMLQKKLIKKLNASERQTLYETIYKKIEVASYQYPSRSYAPEIQEQISASRREATNILLKKGFTGEYPLFHKGNLQVHALEEHPFTILDWEHYSFRIQFMVSESKKNSKALHSGFFQKRGTHSRIVTWDDISHI